MANRQRIVAKRVGATRLCAGVNKTIPTPPKLAEFVKAETGKTLATQAMSKNLSQER